MDKDKVTDEAADKIIDIISDTGLDLMEGIQLLRSIEDAMLDDLHDKMEELTNENT